MLNVLLPAFVFALTAMWAVGLAAAHLELAILEG